MERFTKHFSIAGYVLAAPQRMDRGGSVPAGVGQTAENSRQVRQNRLGPSAGGWHVRSRKKGGAFVGKTKCGKGSKIMTLIDGSGTPLAVDLHSASPAEVTLIEPLLRKQLLRRHPRRLVYDKAADSDPLRERLRSHRIELICPHRANRRRPAIQDGRKLRRYRKRWKVERSISWLQNFRRLVVRYEYHAHLFLGFVHAACMLIALRKLPLRRTFALYTTK
jgi:transposase